MSQDLVKYNRCSSNFEVSSQNGAGGSGSRWSSITTRSNDNVQVRETAKKETVITPRKYTMTETFTRTVNMKPDQKRPSAPSKPASAKKPRMEASTRGKLGPNRVSSSSGYTYSKDFSSDESSSDSEDECSSDSYSDED